MEENKKSVIHNDEQSHIAGELSTRCIEPLNISVEAEHSGNAENSLAKRRERLFHLLEFQRRFGE